MPLSHESPQQWWGLGPLKDQVCSLSPQIAGAWKSPGGLQLNMCRKSSKWITILLLSPIFFHFSSYVNHKTGIPSKGWFWLILMHHFPHHKSSLPSKYHLDQFSSQPWHCSRLRCPCGPEARLLAAARAAPTKIKQFFAPGGCEPSTEPHWSLFVIHYQNY